jgi:hypothetical protein
VKPPTYSCADCGRTIAASGSHFLLTDGRIVCVRHHVEYYDAGRIAHGPGHSCWAAGAAPRGVEPMTCAHLSTADRGCAHLSAPSWEEIREAWATIPPPAVDLSLYGDIDPAETYEDDD